MGNCAGGSRPARIISPTAVIDPTDTTAKAQNPALPGNTVDWGRTSYRLAWERQNALVTRRQASEISDTLVLTEHDPVYTLGARRGAEQHLLWSASQLEQTGIELVKTNRGGDITYHGPGQLVGYPIISLNHHRDLHAYLRNLEQVLINALGSLGLAAARREGKTGIWLAERKIAAIGVAVKRWVTLHGFALNVDPDLAPFTGIVPCGIAPGEGSVSSLARELGPHAPPMDTVKQVVAAEFWNRFGQPRNRENQGFA